MVDGGWDATLAGIREQLDTDERLARAVLDRRAEIKATHGVTVTFRRQPWMVADSAFADTMPPNLPDAASVDALEVAEVAHSDRHTAEAVLRRVESDRRILAIYDAARDAADNDVESEARFYLMGGVVKALAPRYAEVSGFPEVLRLDRAST
jgi:hypothetical protein